MSVIMRVSDGRFRRPLLRLVDHLSSGVPTVDNGHGTPVTVWRRVTEDLSGMRNELAYVIERRKRDRRDCSHEIEVKQLMEAVEYILANHRGDSDRLKAYFLRTAADMLSTAATIASTQPSNL